MALSAAFPATSDALDVQVAADMAPSSPGGAAITPDELASLESGAATMVVTELRANIDHAQSEVDRDTLTRALASSGNDARTLVQEALARNNAGLEPPKETWSHWAKRQWNRL